MSEHGTIERAIEDDRRRASGCDCQVEHGDSACKVHPTCPWCGLAVRAWLGYGAELELCKRSEECINEQAESVAGR